MMSGITSKLLLVLVSLLVCALLSSSLNLADPNEMVDEMPTCKVTVRKETTVEGRCVRLRGGQSACQTDAYLDPGNDDCSAMK